MPFRIQEKMRNCGVLSVLAFITVTLFCPGVTFTSCSTTRCLEEGQLRLTQNKIIVENDNKFPSSDLSSYVKQKTPSWTPMLYVYNWQDGKGKGWDKFVKKAGTPPLVYDSLQAVNTCTNIKDHLENLGYYSSDVEFTGKVNAKRKKIAVTYHVRLGKRYPIKNIEYKLPESKELVDIFNADSANITIHRGDPLSEAALEAESVRSATVIRGGGYYGFSKGYYAFEADTVSVPDSALLKYIVLPHSRNEDNDSTALPQKYTIGDISVVYPNDLNFRSKVLRDLNILKEGDLYNEKKVNVEYQRYNTIGLFSSVNVQMTPRDSVPVVDCSINLQKGKTQGFKLGLEASINTTALFGISPELSYYHRNIFHGGEILNISVSTDHQFRFDDSDKRSNQVVTSASLLIPRFIPFSPKLIKGPYIPKTEVKLSYNFQSRPEYKRHMITASYGYTGRIKEIMLNYAVSPLTINMVWLPYMSDEFLKSIEKDKYMYNTYSNHSDLGATASLYFSNFNYQIGLKDSHGWYAGVQLDISGNVVALFYPIMPKNSSGQGLIFNSPYAQYVKGDFNFGRTWNWSYEKFYHSLALHLEIGIGKAYGNSYSMPFEKQFYSGGANSLRGWTARTVGPGTSQIDTRWTIPNQTGDMKLELNAEYRFKIFWKIAGAIFVEGGNIWNLPVDGKTYETDPSIFSFNNFGDCIAADWGAGLRVDLSFLVLRVDFGMRFHDPARTDSKWLGPDKWFKEGNNAFHFGVGFPF